jgi:hypothetical protein
LLNQRRAARYTFFTLKIHTIILPRFSCMA